MNELMKEGSGLPAPEEMEMLMKYCEVMSKAPAYAAMGGMPGIFALVMTARELGIGPMTALNGGMYMIPPSIDKTTGQPKGSPTIMMAAKTMSMMIWKAGHKIEQLETSDYQVRLRGTRADNGVTMEVTMNMDKAKLAGLSHDMYGKPKSWSTWYKNAEDMLWKTCVAKLGRRLFTDVIGNAYEPAEFDEKEAKEKIESTPEAKKLKGKNVPQVTESAKPIQIEMDNSPGFLSFLDEFGLHLEDPLKQDAEMVAYVQDCASKRNKNYQEMVKYCYDHKEAFLAAYKTHAIKEGIIVPDESEQP